MLVGDVESFFSYLLNHVRLWIPWSRLQEEVCHPKLLRTWDWWCLLLAWTRTFKFLSVAWSKWNLWVDIQIIHFLDKKFVERMWGESNKWWMMMGWKRDYVDRMLTNCRKRIVVGPFSVRIGEVLAAHSRRRLVDSVCPLSSSLPFLAFPASYVSPAVEVWLLLLLRWRSWFLNGMLSHLFPPWLICRLKNWSIPQKKNNKQQNISYA